MRELLLKLCGIPAVSGREEKLTEFILSEIDGFCDAKVDRLGNIICFKKGKNRPVSKVVLDAHTDEVGIIATSITSDGFVKFTTVGGIETAVILCRSVTFENGVKGVVGMKPVHLSSADERKKYPDKDSLYIDIGAASKEEAEGLIRLGDTAVFDSEPALMGDRLKARAIDDRAGVACLITLLKQDAEYDFYATFTVQEEVGTRGAQTAAFAVEPDVSISLEATTAADLEGVSEDKRVCKLGEGPAVSFMDKGNLYTRALYDFAVSCGEKCQPKAYVSGGNNSRAFALSREGSSTLAVSLPCRYIHSPSCVADLTDLEAMLPLCKRLLCAIAGGEVL
ncbi:MAG: M42 family peptidase [Clostridia bacterium]|nr:M42 family peptidase [Clostridia bacterium]